MLVVRIPTEKENPEQIRAVRKLLQCRDSGQKIYNADSLLHCTVY